jgi:hypothetical protein
MQAEFHWEYLKGRDTFRDIGISGKVGCEGVKWSKWLRIGTSGRLL